MARGPVDIRKRIEKQRQKIFELTDELEQAKEAFEKLQEDLKYAEGFLNSVLKKLSNEKFVSGAPAAVVEKERAKQRDAETKIAALKAQIAALMC